MQDIKTRFEAELFNKFANKTRGGQNEEAQMMKAFKYFDVNQCGGLTMNNFAKAVEKLGVVFPT